jgi:hypothetical protein
LFCGSNLFGLKLDMQEAGIAFLNAWGSVKTAAQIYNASRKERLLNKRWQDMELAMHLYGQSSLFVGSPPNTVDQMLPTVLPFHGLLGTELRSRQAI